VPLLIPIATLAALALIGYTLHKRRHRYIA
jgi:hypothetical protein